ncbi:MAG: alkaline phosphatase family protein, partial [Candidatus Kapaibacteriota bacterium]
TKLHQTQIINITEYFNVGGVKINSYGYFAFISGDKDSVAKVYFTLKNKENNFKVYKRDEVPKYYNYSSNAFIGEVVIIPDIGWTISRDTNEYFYRLQGNHGYDNHWVEMHGIFIASGPRFKKNYVTGTIKNIDIYPLMCKILNIIPRNNIDGKLERIEFILK